MDDIDDLQDIQDFQDMAEVLVGPQRPRREKPGFMEEMTDFEFKRTFRFTKDGVESLVGLLAFELYSVTIETLMHSLSCAELDQGLLNNPNKKAANPFIQLSP